MKRRPVEWVIILVAVIVAMGYLSFRGRGDVSATEARRLVEAGARLVDVRTPEEFAAGHLPGAINLPVQELERRRVELEPQERPVVVYCRSGSRSARAARLLESAGFEAIHDLGAMSRW